MPAEINHRVSSPVHLPPTNSHTKSPALRDISNTPQSHASAPASSNTFNLHQITDRLNIRLYQYIQNNKNNDKHFNQVSDALKTCGIEVKLAYVHAHSTHWLKTPETIDDLANILEALLATVTSTRSDLKATISIFLKETKLGKVKESENKKSSFVLRLSDEAKEQRVKDQAIKKRQTAKEVVQKLSSVHNTPGTAYNHHGLSINDSPAIPLNTENTLPQEARASIASADSTPPAYPVPSFNVAPLRSIADRPTMPRSHVDTEYTVDEEISNHHSASPTATTVSLENIIHEKTSRLADQHSSSTSDAADISPSELFAEKGVAQSASLFEPEKPVYLETPADTQNIYSEKTQVVGQKNGQRVLIDFSRLKWRNENIRNLPHLQRLMNEVSQDKKDREKFESYLHKNGLDAIISYQKKHNHLFGNNKYRAKFSPNFSIATMKLASPSLPLSEEEPSLENARQKVLNTLTEYFGEKGGIKKSHHDKLKKTLTDSALRELLMVTSHGAIAWVDQATWPKDADAFNTLLRAFSKHHGSNGSLDLKTRSSLLKELQGIVAHVPHTQVSHKFEDARKADAKKIINKEVARQTKDATDTFLQEQLIAYARGELVENIDTLVHEFVERSFQQSKIDEKAQTLLGKAEGGKLDTQTNQSAFEKFCEFFRHPVNVVKEQTDAMHRDNYAAHFINLDAAYQKAFEQNTDIVYALYSRIDKKTIDKVNDILVVADPKNAFGNGAAALKEKVRTECIKQIDKKMATLVGRIDASFSAKITQAINHFNTAQTNQSGAALREWFTTFSGQIDAYKAFCADRLAYISNADKWAALASDNESVDQSDSFNREDTIASIAAHHKQCVEHLEKTLSNALLSAIKAMDFSGRLRHEIRQCNNPKLSRVDKAERLTQAMSNYKEGVEEALRLMQTHNGLKEFKDTQRDAFLQAQNEATKRYPQALSRWGRIKQLLFGEAKKLTAWEHITKGLSKTRKTVLGLGFLTGGAALGLGIASAVGVGVFTVIFAPIMVPMVTTLFIAAGAAILLGITGYALSKLKRVYRDDVHNRNELIKQRRSEFDDHVSMISESLIISVSTLTQEATQKTNHLTAASLNISPSSIQAVLI